MGNKLCLYAQKRSRKQEGAYVAPTAEMNGLVSLRVNFLLIAVVVMVLSILGQRTKQIEK